MLSVMESAKVATFTPQGYVSAANADEFLRELSEAVKAQEKSVLLVDMHKVEFLDSAGLMALVNGFRLSQNLGTRFTLCCLAPSVRMIFELTQLDKIFEILENQDSLPVAI